METIFRTSHTVITLYILNNKGNSACHRKYGLPILDLLLNIINLSAGRLIIVNDGCRSESSHSTNLETITAFSKWEKVLTRVRTIWCAQALDPLKISYIVWCRIHSGTTNGSSLTQHSLYFDWLPILLPCHQFFSSILSRKKK